MSKVSVRVQFEGTTWLTLDPDEYPHYFGPNGAGLSQLIEDVFYDDTSDWGGTHIDRDSTEVTDAWFGDPESEDDEEDS